MNRFLIALLAAVPVVFVAAGCSSSDSPTPTPTTDDPSQLGEPLKGQGFQIRTALFPVDAGQEIQNCYFYKVSDLAKSNGLPGDQPVNLHRVQIVQKAGSHHMNIFRVRTVVNLGPQFGDQLNANGTGECFKSSNWADWPLVANTQAAGQLDWSFPDGVANVFQPDEWLMVQSHFVNATSQKSPDGGQVAINFHTVPASEVKQEMGTIFATKQSIRVCKSNPNPTFTGSCNFGNKQGAQIIAANGHFHSRGKQFDMFEWNGTDITPDPTKQFYQSNTWDEPPMMKSPELNLAVPPGGGVQYSCSFEWLPPSDEAGGCAALDAYDVAKHPDAKPDCCYTFGPIVEKNEHCNAFVYYYPKQDDVNCF